MKQPTESWVRFSSDTLSKDIDIEDVISKIRFTNIKMPLKINFKHKLNFKCIPKQMDVTTQDVKSQLRNFGTLNS